MGKIELLVVLVSTATIAFVAYRLREAEDSIANVQKENKNLNKEVCEAKDSITKLQNDNKNLKEEVKQLLPDLLETVPGNCHEGGPIDCGDIQRGCPSGVYKIYPKQSPSVINVYCEMEIDGGGWTVFQKRYDGQTDFYRDWRAYTQGFGDPSRDYWIGNRNLHLLTTKGSCELRIDMKDFDGSSAFAKYNHFKVGSEATNFVLSVSGYYGIAGDSLGYHNGMKFSTEDRDNDINSSNCAKVFRGAWWFNSCEFSNLNGEYFNKHPSSSHLGVYWRHWKGSEYSLKASTMMIRRWKSDIWEEVV